MSFATFALLAALAKYVAGTDIDVQAKLHGPVLNLTGSSASLISLQAMVNAVRGCDDCEAKLDVVVLRASGSNALNEDFMQVNGVNSSTTYVITDRDSGNRRDVVRSIDRAEIVWFAGGDQCNYIRWIKGTRAHRAVQRLYARGGGVGGNSAGLAIQGDVVYDACPDVSAESKVVLANPFSRDVSLSTNFFHWPALKNTITDTHFSQRERLGRTLVFLARSYAERGQRIDALGIDAQTSVIVTPDGKGRVYGAGSAFLIEADHPAGVLKSGVPLTYRGLKMWKYKAGDTIDLLNRPTSGYATVDVVEGKIVNGDPLSASAERGSKSD